MWKNFNEILKKGRLYLIPSPIYNNHTANILSKEVIEAIKRINIYIVENIRTTRRYIKLISPDKDIDKINFYSYGKHDTIDLQEDFLNHILNGKDIGILSESGLPCIADPGSKIVEFAHQYNIRVMPISGPSSIFLSLIASGMNGQNFSFLGYLPIHKKERNIKIKNIETISKSNNQTQIFIEAPYRNIQLYNAIISVCKQNSKLCIACQLTSNNQLIVTKTINEWKSSNPPDIHKKETVFLLSGF